MQYPFYKELLNHYGHQHWWPGKTQFEIIVGAILTQNTAWKNVELAIQNLNSRGIDSMKILKQTPISILQSSIKPAGFYQSKSNTLKLVCEWFIDNHSQTTNWTTSEFRTLLLSIKGIGPETADSILLYAFHRLTSVADKYSHRLGYRLGELSAKSKYNEIADWVMTNAPQTVQDQNEIHALIVSHSKRCCKKKNPTCMNCPLTHRCPKRLN